MEYNNSNFIVNYYRLFVFSQNIECYYIYKYINDNLIYSKIIVHNQC